MLDFLIVLVMFIVLFSITHNVTVKETIQKMVDAIKQLWKIVMSCFESDDPTNPYL